jgi:hypothetical protein
MISIGPQAEIIFIILKANLVALSMILTLGSTPSKDFCPFQPRKKDKGYSCYSWLS